MLYVLGITVFYTELERYAKFIIWQAVSYNYSSVVVSQSLHQLTEGSMELRGQNKTDKALKNEKMRSVKAKGCQLLPTFRS